VKKGQTVPGSHLANLLRERNLDHDGCLSPLLEVRGANENGPTR
jgi:hypothetical protein